MERSANVIGIFFFFHSISTAHSLNQLHSLWSTVERIKKKQNENESDNEIYSMEYLCPHYFSLSTTDDDCEIMFGVKCE